MTGQPEVSIVINNWNYGEFLGKAIDSALAQTHPACEVVVVDDGSTDDSREVVARYKGRIRALSKPNGGQASAMNAGYAVSTGEVVVFLDSDDVLVPHAAASVVGHFADPSVAKVHWRLELIDAAGRPLGRRYPGGTLAEGDLREAAVRLGPTHHLSAPASGNAWARWFLDAVMPLDEAVFRVAADTPLFETAPFLGTLRVVDEPLTRYRYHDRNTSRQRLGIETRVAREVAYFESYTRRIAELLADQGIRADVDGWRERSWWHRQQRALEEIRALPAADGAVLLVDDTTWEQGATVGGRPRRPFPESGGAWAGPPADDAEAIAALARACTDGAAFLVIVWPSFWWLDHYTGFAAHLRVHHPCLIENDRLVAFDLREGCRS